MRYRDLPEESSKEPKPQKSARKKSRILSFLVVLFIVLAGFALLWWVVKQIGDKPITSKTEEKNKKSTSETSEKQPPKEKPKVRVYKVSRENFVHVMETLGTIDSKSKVDLRFEVNGVVEVINVEENDQVRDGDILAELGHHDSELKVDFFLALFWGFGSFDDSSGRSLYRMLVHYCLFPNGDFKNVFFRLNAVIVFLI